MRNSPILSIDFSPADFKAAVDLWSIGIRQSQEKKGDLQAALFCLLKHLLLYSPCRHIHQITPIAQQNAAHQRQFLQHHCYLVNRAGGIIAGRDVTLTTTEGDVINDRTLTTHQSSSEDLLGTQRYQLMM
ncbi:hypothetical protein GV819_21650 [Pseudomonas sp. Fl5BN2]|uniref:hypothetical protein n=1 Tax=Pseudomonas sp. Fl5BN2 TaxID=2697652 RepID=UPI0013769701|nr:hypothetical protein [Pseudomonas sp. Fl5BN2]NBF04894.1 hypothetical protein [Pseudomonas sp. Fl5BN2]